MLIGQRIKFFILSFIAEGGAGYARITNVAHSYSSMNTEMILLLSVLLAHTYMCCPYVHPIHRVHALAVHRFRTVLQYCTVLLGTIRADFVDSVGGFVRPWNWTEMSTLPQIIIPLRFYIYSYWPVGWVLGGQIARAPH